jgi:integrase
MAHIREVKRKKAPNGIAYEVQWREGEKKMQRTLTVKREAERHAARVETAKETGETTKPLALSKTTVADVISASLAASKPGLKPRTYDGYVRLYDGRIIPEFGNKRVVSVTRGDVQAWVTRLSADGLAPATVHHCYEALRKAMKHALYDRIIAHDPCAGVKLTKDQRTDADFKPVFLTVAQVGALAAHLSEAKPYDVMVRFTAYTGLRAGEMAGLRVRDVDLAAGHVEVRQTAQFIRGGWVFGTPKSRRSSRDVPILDRRLLADLKTFKMQHPRSGDPDALFWPGRMPGSHFIDYSRVWDVASFRRNYFKPALALAKLPPMRVHDLRHTAASLWLTAGFPPYQVSRWLGHANVVTTDTIYSHLYPTDYARHVERFERFAAEG